MTDTDNVKFALYTQIFMKLRRHGRVIDVVWALQEPVYGQEVLRLARGIHDPELDQIAEKLEALTSGAIRPAPKPPVLRAESSLMSAPAEDDDVAPSDSISEHYIGHLR